MSEVQVENPFVNASTQSPAPVIEAEIGSQQPEISSDGAAEPATEVATVDTCESVLHGLMLGLEGMKHMSKSEIESIVDAARAKYEAL